MKPLKVSGTNFQSYGAVEFNYAELGPTLIAGPTKAGKSTVLDLLCWTLFGVTSKESAADDVRSWFSDEPTSGEAVIECGKGLIVIERIRGKRSSQNDLRFAYVTDGEVGEWQRGKDAADTQSKIEEVLGVTGQLFSSAAYIHQFSKSDTFFVAQAKYRREIIETIQDLSAPVRFAEKCAEAKKKAKADLAALELANSKVSGRIEALRSQITSLTAQSERHEQSRAHRISQLQAAAESFEKDKEARLMKLVDQLEQLDQLIVPTSDLEKRAAQIIKQTKQAEVIVADVNRLESDIRVAQSDVKTLERELTQLQSLKGNCPTCKGPADNAHSSARKVEVQQQLDIARTELEGLVKEHSLKKVAIEQHRALLQANITVNKEKSQNDSYIAKFEALKAQAGSIRDEKSSHQAQIEELLSQKDPYVAQIKKTEADIEALRQSETDNKIKEDLIRANTSAIEWLYEASFKAKAALLTDAVRRLRDRTNEVLQTYFDGALRVEMQIDDGDKIEVSIQNDGYDCPFKQLSGGERCMLKLAFNVAYMEAAQNCAGVHIDTIMLDEALNGLDSDLKVKAYGLIEDLASRHGSVICIEHSEEFKLMFPRRFLVEKSGSKSSISELST